MNLFALSFDHLEVRGETNTHVYRFVPIGIEQKKGNYTASMIPTGKVGQVVEIDTPNSQYKTPFMIVGENKFRSLNMDELTKWIEDKAGYGVPNSN